MPGSQKGPNVREFESKSDEITALTGEPAALSEEGGRQGATNQRSPNRQNRPPKQRNRSSQIFQPRVTNLHQESEGQKAVKISESGL